MADANQVSGGQSSDQPGEQMNPQQLDPWMEQPPKPAAPDTRGEEPKADPIDAQQSPLGYVPAEGKGEGRRDADADQPTQVEAEWQPPELSGKKIDKTVDLPHARKFDH